MGLTQFNYEFKLSTETMMFYCTNGFYMLQGFQRHIICKISSYRMKDMNFWSFDTNSGLNSNLNRVSIWGRLMSMHASVLVDSVGPPSAEVCRAAASFP
jgi:hypothetical protein